MKEVKFKIEELPLGQFTTLLKGNQQKELLDEAARVIANRTNRDYGKYKDLAIHLYKKCNSFNNIKPSSIWDTYIPYWKRNKMYLPLDCFFELCKLTNKNPEKWISKIKYKTAPNKSGIKFNFRYDKELAYLGEAIRVEGHIRNNLSQINLSNKDINFINKIKKIARKYLSKNHIYELFSIEADIPENVEVLNVKDNKRILKFNTYKAARSKKRKICFYDKIQKFPKRYEIITSYKKIYVNIIMNKGELISNSNYGVVSTCLNLTIHNTTFTRLLHILLNIPKSKKSDIIKMPKILKEANKEIKIEALNAILDTEAWISKRHEKRIGIGMNSKNYLKDIKRLFNKVGVQAYIRKNDGYVYITSKRDIEKVRNIFKLTSYKKTLRIISILNSYIY